MSTIQPNKRSDPLTRDEFHAQLRAWAKQHLADRESVNPDLRIDGAGGFGQKPCMWVKSPTGTLCYLNGDTKLKAVVQYLNWLSENPKLAWQKGNETSEAFRVDPGGEYLECFQFYRLKKQS
jgi:hypothetical protein